MIAALYVQRNGCYWNLPDVDPWDEARDARLYAGPWPVVAHPPCVTWSRLAEMAGHRKGDDSGCFAAAFTSVRIWGGVLEHPANSRAWARHGLNRPPRAGGWTRAGIDLPGVVCEVEQGHYGHRARKPTWLYAVHCEVPALRWGVSRGDQGRGHVGRVRGEGPHAARVPRPAAVDRALGREACSMTPARKGAE